jgi:serine/threonine-protein kinase
MAEIFLARPTEDPTGRRLAVLKRINEAFAHEAEFVEMFLDEARISVHLNHPGVVRTYGLERDGKSYYMAMEYLSGESLQDVITEGSAQENPLPFPYGVRLVSLAAEALHYAHHAEGPDGESLRIVHRDVSPHNLFVTYKGKLKVVDFGIAKATIKNSQTQTGYVKGKLGYLSPEQIRQGEVDGRTDVFALGIVLFETLTGSNLFDERYSDTEVVMAIGGTKPLPLPSERNGEVPPELDRICAKAMALDVRQRYASGEAFQRALEGWLDDQREDPTPEEIGRHVRDLFPDRVERKEEMIRVSLQADAQRAPTSVDDATSTELDLSSHPEIQRLIRENAKGSKKPRPSQRSAPAKPAAPRTQETTLPPRGDLGLSPIAWALAGLVAMGVFTATVKIGQALRRRPPPEPPPVAHLEVVTPPGTEVLLDGEAFAPAAPLRPGRHRVVAHRSGITQAQEVDLAAGERRQVSFTFPTAGP